MKPILIVGSYLSPYVRKVLVCLELKGMDYEVDHIVPFFGDDRFSKLSPLRRIPVLVDGDLVLTDSTAICEYIEDKQPAPALLPADIRDRARARWLEEFADTRMGDVFIWRLFNQIAIRPSVWGEKGDRELVDRNLKEDVPMVLDYLESEAPADDSRGGFRFGALSIADIAVACFFRGRRSGNWARRSAPRPTRRRPPVAASCRSRAVPHIHPFVWGHVIGALIVGAASGSSLDMKAVLTFSGLLAANAAIGSLVCWWRPGLDAAAWKLWPMATFANPMMLAAIAFSIDQYDCLTGRASGWNCMLSDVGPLTVAACLPSPLIGLAVRWLKRRSA